jgi:hypothetical protein
MEAVSHNEEEWEFLTKFDHKKFKEQFFLLQSAFKA